MRTAIVEMERWKGEDSYSGEGKVRTAVVKRERKVKIERRGKGEGKVRTAIVERER